MIHGDIKQHDTTIVFHSGTKLIGDEYVTNGGRVLGVVGLGKDLRTALDRAYGRIEHMTLKVCNTVQIWSEKLSNKEKVF